MKGFAPLCFSCLMPLTNIRNSYLITPMFLFVMFCRGGEHLTCITHVVVKRCVREMPTAAGFVARLGVLAAFILGGGVGVSTQISGLHRGLRLQTRVVARLNLRYSPEHVVQPETVADLMDHGVSVAERAVEGGIQHNSTWENTDTHMLDVNTAVCTQQCPCCWVK